MKRRVLIGFIGIVITITAIAGFYFLTNKTAVTNLVGVQSFDFEKSLCSEELETYNMQLTSTRQWLLKDTPESYTEFSTASLTLNDTPETVDEMYIQFNKDNSYRLKFSNNQAIIGSDNLKIGSNEGETFLYNKEDNCYYRGPVTKIEVSHPMIVITSTDWEGFDVTDNQLKILEFIAEDYNLKFTHFFNPRIYLPSAMSQQRADYLTKWIKNRNEEVGLHLHMYFDVANAAGVSPRKKPAWQNRATGSDVPLSAYSATEIDKIISWGNQTLERQGFDSLNGFRAGGWMANEDVLKVIEQEGFLYDSSGRDDTPIGINQISTDWSLDATTQPYKISVNDKNISENDSMNLYEFPNNGLEGNRNSGAQMYSYFTKNYDVDHLEQPKTITYLIHPQFAEGEVANLRFAYDRISKKDVRKDNGPVVFLTMNEAYNYLFK